MIDYYVVREKNTGLYFRGKGANRWGKYYNQASIYRIKAHAENSARWLSMRGEHSEVVPIQIIENHTRDFVEVVRCENCKNYNGHRYCKYLAETVLDNDFCSYRERKDNEIPL